MESVAALLTDTETLDAELIEVVRADHDWIDAVFDDIVSHLTIGRTRQPLPPHS